MYVALGGALGAVSRFITSRFMNQFFGVIPMGTLIVNVLGSFLLGFIMFAVLLGKNISPDFQNFFAVGFIGALTTMSTFAYESVRFGHLNEWSYFFLNMGANIILSLGAVACGGYIATLLYS